VGLFNLVAGLSKSKAGEIVAVGKNSGAHAQTVKAASSFLSEPLGHFLMRH
jgi:hypothetical protein